VDQLKNIIKKLTDQQDGVDERRRRQKAGGRAFDFRLYRRRHVLFRVAYFGWNYHGFAVQETTGKTVESELFRALTLTRLIESRETSNYHRCGRTDKGVSALGQVISIDVRTNMLEGPGVFDYEGCRADERDKKDVREIDYCKVLNANLPPDIQVLAWAPCPRPDFSARFDCSARAYRYFFPLARLDLLAMNEAAELLVGEHDFRNLCKPDVANGVVNYRRRIIRASVRCLDTSSSAYTMCVAEIEGKAFLWHQIRCIMSILFLVGQGKEPASVVSQLLDVEANPRRPQYVMAADFPLNLFECRYDDVTAADWIYEPEAVRFLLRQFQAVWTEHQVKATMAREALERLESDAAVANAAMGNCSNNSHDKKGNEDEGNDMQALLPGHQLDPLLPRSRAKSYTPLMQMLTCPSVEEKIENCKRLKLSQN